MKDLSKFELKMCGFKYKKPPSFKAVFCIFKQKITVVQRTSREPNTLFDCWSRVSTEEINQKGLKKVESSRVLKTQEITAMK